jgi:hypothetical protein
MPFEHDFELVRLAVGKDTIKVSLLGMGQQKQLAFGQQPRWS